LGVCGLAIERQFGIEFSWTPTVQHRPYVCLIDVQQIGEWAEIGSERCNSADIQIAIGPTIEAATHTTSAGVRLDRTCTERGKGAVNCRVANRTLNPDGFERPGVEKAGQPNYSVQLQQLKRDCWIIQINLASPQLVE
jgi:hypothetical protein